MLKVEQIFKEERPAGVRNGFRYNAGECEELNAAQLREGGVDDTTGR